MADPFLGEIRLMASRYVPPGWAMCDGQALSAAQNSALAGLLGITYGGVRDAYFNLPDLRGRVPIHMGNGHVLGEQGGELAHTLSIAELPAHVHTMNASSASSGGNANPNGRVLGGGNNVYHAAGSLTTLSPTCLGSIGGNQAHLNMQPFLTLNFCIAIIPSQSVYPRP